MARDLGKPSWLGERQAVRCWAARRQRSRHHLAFSCAPSLLNWRPTGAQECLGPAPTPPHPSACHWPHEQAPGRGSDGECAAGACCTFSITASSSRSPPEAPTRSRWQRCQPGGKGRGEQQKGGQERGVKSLVGASTNVALAPGGTNTARTDRIDVCRFLVAPIQSIAHRVTAILRLPTQLEHLKALWTPLTVEALASTQGGG